MNINNWFLKFKFSFLRKLVLLILGIVLSSEFLFAQGNNQSVTTITIKNSRNTEYKKNEETGNDSIILKGDVRLTVQKDSSTSEISADTIIYDRKTEMLYAEGNVSIVTKDSSSGNDTATADSLLLNTSTLEAIFDGGKVVQTQSDALSLPSGSTLIVFAQMFGRSESNAIAFKNSSLTFCDDPNPHWHIDATRTWLLPGGEFAFFNALLYVGVVPVLYLPAFYYPKDELIFNPVFGSQPRKGNFIQNTYYLIGRKASDSSTSSTTSTSSSSSDATAEAMKGLYNFMKPSVLKEQKREGLMLHNLDEDYKGNSNSSVVKIMADWYENLGYMTGVSGKIVPKNTYISSFDFDAQLGFSNTIYRFDENYTSLDSRGLKTMDDSQFLGLHMPFRYSGNLSLSVSKPIRITLTLPIYSDPYFSNDFSTRSESMDWISYLMSLANPEDSSTVTESTQSSYTWQFSASYSPTIPNSIKTYISSVSMNLNSSVNISSVGTNSSSLREYAQSKNYTTDWQLYSPRRSFYYPSQVTPASFKTSISGTIFEYPKSVSTSSNSSSSTKYETPNLLVMNKPDEFKTEKEIQAEEENRIQKELAENQSKNENSTDKNENSGKDETSTEIQIFEYTPALPQLTVSSSSSNKSSAVNTVFKFKLGYTISPDIVSQFTYSNQNLKMPEDFDWTNRRASMLTIKSPVTLSSNLNYGGDFVSLTDKISYNPVLQNHPYINTDVIGENETVSEYKARISALGGYTTDEAKSLIRADYTASSQDIAATNSLKIKPLYAVPLFEDSSISFNTNLKLFRYEFTGNSDDENWEENWKNSFESFTLWKMDKDYEDDDVKNDPENFITSNSIDVTLASSQMDKKIKESFTLTSVLWPLTNKYTGHFSLSLPNTTFSLSTAYTPEQDKNPKNAEIVNPNKIIKEKWDPITQSFSYSINLFNSPLKFTESLSWDKNTGIEKDEEGNEINSLSWNEKFTNFKLSTSWKVLSISYVMSYTQGAELIFENKNPVKWETKNKKEFLPYSLSFTFNPSIKSLFKNDNLSLGLNSSLNVDLIKATNSNFTFSPSLTIKTNAINITFSSSSRNSVLYWYFHEGAGDYAKFGTDIFSGFGNMLWDLGRSYHFSKESDRKASGYKLKSLSMTMSRDLHDWKFNMSFSVSPRLVGKEYKFDPYMTIGVVWNPMASIKTEITDEYGKWQLNK